ncbi:hypothetical protein GCM10028807_57820 [Spirosoma daeguense]
MAKDPKSEREYMPLPGDNEESQNTGTDPREAFMILATAMGAEITSEPSEL